MRYTKHDLVWLLYASKFGESGINRCLINYVFLDDNFTGEERNKKIGNCMSLLMRMAHAYDTTPSPIYRSGV